MATLDILMFAFSKLELVCRLPDGLPLVLYLPSVDSWAYGEVQWPAQGVECSPAENAPEKQMQHPPPASPFRCAANPSQISDFQRKAGVEHVAPFMLPKSSLLLRRNAACDEFRAP